MNIIVSYLTSGNKCKHNNTLSSVESHDQTDGECIYFKQIWVVIIVTSVF